MRAPGLSRSLLPPGTAADHRASVSCTGLLWDCLGRQCRSRRFSSARIYCGPRSLPTPGKIDPVIVSLVKKNETVEVRRLALDQAFQFLFVFLILLQAIMQREF